MDRLRQAAQVGNTNELYKCIQEEIDVRRYIDDDKSDDKLINQTPLHITAISGHVDFAMALMNLKPSWGRKLNQELYSPMHLAVLYGHTDLVLALLAVDKDLVRVKGRDGYTALHYAAEKENLDILARFLKDCPACVEDVTIRDETALHVAAQNDRLKALEVLALYLQRTHLYCKVSKIHLLDSKDRDDNTVLHIAASNTQPKMIKLLLRCMVSKKEINKRRLTASELLETQSRETPNREICLNIIHKGRRWVVVSPKEVVYFFFFRNHRVEPLHKTLRYQITCYELTVMLLTGRNVRMSADKINALLVVSALILTATYQAMLSPPGGVWQGSYSANTTSAETHVGQSVMSFHLFSLFYVLNMEVFVFTSILTVGLLQVVSASEVVALLFEILLSLLLGGHLLAMQVIEPNYGKSWPFQKMADANEIKKISFLFPFAFILVMEILRRYFQCLLNPPAIRFFKRVFRDQM